MPAKKTAAKQKAAPTPPQTGGIPYTLPDGTPCSRAEYVAATREANRQAIVDALRSPDAAATEGEQS